jgi:hypothetical protein
LRPAQKQPAIAVGEPKSVPVEVTEADAREVLQRVLVAWSLLVHPDDFEKENPDIHYGDLNNIPISIRSQPQSFTIVGCRKTKDQSGNPRFEFSVTLTYASESGTGINKAARYVVTRTLDAPQPWDVLGRGGML